MTLPDFQGHPVILTAEAWQHVIMPHHDYMADMPEVIGDALRYPDAVRRSSTRPATVRLYYKWIVGTPVGDKWVCVVVKYIGDEAFVLTAYATDAIKQGEPL